MYPMSTITTGLSKFQTTTIESYLLSSQIDKATIVRIRLVFLRIGEIDTLNEKYQAHVSIESRWSILFEKFSYNLSSDDQQRLNNGKSVSLEKYSQSYWHPQLYIENGLGDLKEQIKYSAKLNKENHTIDICEHRDIKGFFWEKLELQHFPSDIQGLSVSITSMFFTDKVILTADPNYFSGINREAFVDQQEWSLYEHIDTKQRYINEFLFQTNDDDDDDQDNDNQQVTNNTENRKRSILTVTCHAARQSEYFFWNGFCLIFLITLLSFCTFGIPLQNLVNRLQVTCTVVLTSITFRWTVNRSLPTISYLTSLDKYGLLCIFNLVFHAIWHSIISVIAWEYTTNYSVTKNSWIMYLDRGAFCVFFSFFIILHIAMIIWFYRVPFKLRRQMKQKDDRYRILIQEKKNQSIKQIVFSDLSTQF
ncbi:unnamed protein product [Adineta steineri]|uniref:Uncharacterized protein n=1 Tax=Adineta steineri TaxID=433720 RepID=A0A815RQD7_9BILA|nr:unnamed protein product [Adineta steineri]CAF1480109.1 unnamed protein product [Adineta steineri]CAF3515913.1 unnamed protein product [Adineta steineri]CAF3785516.1 unnamed protein product [Adineta steineri]